MILLTSPEPSENRVEITVYGDLDAVRGVELRHVLGTLTAATVELDLAHVGFIDCAGARALLRADEHMRDLGREVIILRPSGPVLRLLRLLGFDRYLLIRHPGDAVGASRTPPGH
ncbi:MULTISPECIES: STAS domain-containing protein [unclassified Streptosporangium]|uniref:STAS domain-containing protein n=1 Tax=unclassified Streptosporangium TaxID=2632669 RepID=UPI002E290277|nr:MULTISPECIES: STAS domain-containing protein [unclassified Streptosporangium]